MSTHRRRPGPERLHRGPRPVSSPASTTHFAAPGNTPGGPRPAATRQPPVTDRRCQAASARTAASSSSAAGSIACSIGVL